MSGLLGSVFSFGDDLKKRLRGLLHDPIGSASAEVGAFNDKAQSAARGLLSGQDKGGMRSVDALGAGPHALGGLLGAIKVYHGSPHVFDKADSSKIGTGEGAQAYGHGLYWAENPEVAQTYLGTGKAKGGDKAEARLADLMSKATDAGRYGEALALEELLINRSPAKAIQRFSDPNGGQQHKDALAAVKKYASMFDEAGHMYEANLRWPDAAREAKDPLGPQHFLDWDKPLSQQPQSVQDLVNRVAAERAASEKHRPLQLSDIRRDSQGQPVEQMSGGAIHGYLSSPRYGGSMPQTTEQLRAAGIPGVAYYDNGSRAAGQGTRNYVTFDDALVELLSRNGLAIK
jgi:hypothetical protein